MYIFTHVDIYVHVPIEKNTIYRLYLEYSIDDNCVHVHIQFNMYTYNSISCFYTIFNEHRPNLESQNVIEIHVHTI